MCTSGCYPLISSFQLSPQIYFIFRQEKDEAADEKKEDEKKEDEKKEDETGPSPSKKPRPAAASSDVKEIVFSFDTTGSMYPCLTQVIISCMC